MIGGIRDTRNITVPILASFGYKALSGAGASDPDVRALLQDPYFNALVNWNNTPEADQERIQREHPETADLTEIIEDARYDAYDLSRWLDYDVRRTIDDVVIPIVTIGSIILSDIFAPEFAPVTAPVLAANCARIAPVLSRFAAAYGVEEIYRGVTNFFKKTGGDKSGATPGSRGPAPTPHSQSPYTPTTGERLASGFQKHLNRLDELREIVVYEIYRVRDGLTMKFGETAAGYFKSEGMKGVLKRPYRQIMQADKKGIPGLRYREVAKFSTKKEARAFESQKIDQARTTNPNACPMNKGRH
jgi:hypothetical protein